MDDILLVGEVIEVVGINTKAKVYEEKNTAKLLYNGKIIKNVAVGNYVKILKGYTVIIAVIDGEYIKESKNTDSFSKFTDTFTRVLDLKILGYINENGMFKKGIYETPMISNYVYVLEEEEVQKIFCFRKESDPVIEIGRISGYDNYKLKLAIQRLFASHMGIFGNTGSGKSNTLVKIYSELFSSGLKTSKSKFIFIDFNDEYISGEVLTANKKVYKLNTKTKNGDKYPLPREVLENSGFWSIILDATEKTQRPFLERVLKSYKFYRNRSISFDDIVRTIQENPAKFNNVRSEISSFVQKIYGGAVGEYDRLFDEIEYFNYKDRSCLCVRSCSQYFDTVDKFQEYLKVKISELNIADIFNPVRCQEFDPLNLFEIVLHSKYIHESLKGYSNDEHVSPMIKRSEKRIDEISKVLKFKDLVTEDRAIEVVSISNCNIYMKKIVPLLICKEVYEKQKESVKGTQSLHLIIDEAHNILSENSSRESASWKDYRLEVFEEIIKEGRKFGCFITISSQRPSDISSTLVSQLHNYFIHRLVNDEDLFTIRKSVSFLDKSKQDMIPILSQGQCICSGLALDFPVNVQVDELPDIYKPDSKDLNIVDLWGLEESSMEV